MYSRYLWKLEGRNIEQVHQGICQVTQAGHLAVFPHLGLEHALPLPLGQPHGGQVDYDMPPLVDLCPVPANGANSDTNAPQQPDRDVLSVTLI